MDKIYLIHNTFNKTRFAVWVSPQPPILEHLSTYYDGIGDETSLNTRFT